MLVYKRRIPNTRGQQRPPSPAAQPLFCSSNDLRYPAQRPVARSMAAMSHAAAAAAAAAASAAADSAAAGYAGAGCAGADCAAGDSMAGRASTASIPVVVVSEGGTDTALAALEAAGGDIRAARLGNSFLSWSC